MTPLQMSMNPIGLEARLKHRVRVEANLNDDGAKSDAEGIVSPDWQPVAGLSAVKCLIYEMPSQRSLPQELTEDLTFTKIMFAISPALPRDRQLRFAYYDAVAGHVIHYYAHGKVTAPAGAYQMVIARLGAID